MQHDLPSETADTLALAKHLTPIPSRITYFSLTTSLPLHMTLARLRTIALTLPPATPLTVLLGRSRRDAPSHTAELATYLKANLERVQGGICASSEVRRSLGDVGTAVLVAGVGEGNLLVVQAGNGVKGKDKGV